jgi:hypothetical protein
MSKAMRLWGAALGVLVAGTLFVRLTEAQSVRKPPVLEASRVVIRDAEGRVRGMIGVTEDNEAGLSFFDVKGKQRCRILVEADGPPKLALAGPDETSRIGLAVQNDGAATLRVGDSGGEIGIVAEPGGETVLMLIREDKPRMLWGVDSAGRELTGRMLNSPTGAPGRSGPGSGPTAPGPW